VADWRILLRAALKAEEDHRDVAKVGLRTDLLVFPRHAALGLVLLLGRGFRVPHHQPDARWT
jgi:hypothetical protein